MRYLVALVPLTVIATLSAQTPAVPVPAPFNALPLLGQTAPPPPWDAPHLQFDVASVKANKSGPTNIMIRMLPSNFTVTNLPLRTLIMQAYRVSQYQLVGAPGWLDSERFDIIAKAPAGTRPEDTTLMLRGLLADRFKLKVRGDTRETQIYALVLARSDGRLGPKMSKSTDDCEKIIAERRAAATAARAGGAGPLPIPFTPPGPNEKPVCAMNMRPMPVSNGPPLMALRAGGQPLQILVNQISGLLNRRVVDRTGLAGLYDFELQYSMMAQGPLTTAPAGATTPTAPIDDGPTIFDAVRELGLKLESERGPVEHLVIESVERPTED
jgi:uncharacterized protein (TIGR03435 family)